MTQTTPRRRYRMTQRSNAVADTRERIAKAAFELHAEVGPAHTTISAIAERAGVQRHTVYRHFPDLVSLFRACTAHGMSVTEPPDPNSWRQARDALERLRRALVEMYAYYARNERLIGNMFRDLPVMAEAAAGVEQYEEYVGSVWRTVLEPWAELEGASGERVRALASTALEFGTWQALVRRGGLTDDAAADAMVGAVRAALPDSTVT